MFRPTTLSLRGCPNTVRLFDEISDPGRRPDFGRKEDRKAGVEARAGVRKTKSLEVRSRPRAAIWFPTSHDRGTVCGTPFEDRMHPCIDETRHCEGERCQSNVAGGTVVRL